MIPLQYDYATYFSNGLALVRKGDHWFYIDKNGDLKLDKAGANFSEGLAAISIESGLYTQLCGFMDTKGRLVIPYRFEEVGDFHEGFARFRSREKWGYVDKTGKIVVRALYDTADDFSEGLAAVTLNGKSGYINGSGVVRIALQYDHAESFANGMANVSRSGMELYITNTQEIVWPKSLRTGKKE